MDRNRMAALNGIIVTITAILCAVLGMIEVSLFIRYYGSEINGLVQTGNQVLNYLTLIEAGLGAAYLYQMYKPIADQDSQQLSQLFTGFRISMRRAVNIMIGLAVLLSALYPLFLSGSGLPYLQMISIFVLLSMKAILPYKVTMVPKYMIIVKEMKYKAEWITGLCRSITYGAEIVVLLLGSAYSVRIPVQLLLFLCICISLMTGLWFQMVMKKVYKETLDSHAAPDLSPRRMSKDILVHNISKMVFSSTDNIIISTMGSLEAVTIYSSYNMIVGQVVELAQKFMDGVTATLGIKIAHEDNNSSSLFMEMMAGSYWLGGIISTVYISVINDFVALWIGEVYCVNALNVVLFAMVLYCGAVLPCIQVARNACGLYQESRNFTAAQALANLIITIALVPSLGITGALIGTVSARILITIPFNYQLVCRRVFPALRAKWAELAAGMILVPAIAYVIHIVLLSVGPFDSVCVTGFIAKLFIASLLSIVIYTVYYYAIDPGFRSLVRRLRMMIRRKKA